MAHVVADCHLCFGTAHKAGGPAGKSIGFPQLPPQYKSRKLSYIYDAIEEASQTLLSANHFISNYGIQQAHL